MLETLKLIMTNIRIIHVISFLQSMLQRCAVFDTFLSVYALQYLQRRAARAKCVFVTIVVATTVKRTLIQHRNVSNCCCAANEHALVFSITSVFAIRIGLSANIFLDIGISIVSSRRKLNGRLGRRGRRV